MRFLRYLLALLWVLWLPFAAVAAEAVATHAEAGAHEKTGHHALTPAAVPVFKLGPLEITNSMVVVWIVAAILVLVTQLAVRNVALVPSGLQNFWEWLVESLYSFLEGILGRSLARRSFWYFSTIFIVILFTNWFGLIPGVGSVGWGVRDAAGHFEITHPLLRGGNADLNVTASMALLFAILWFWWSFQELGFSGFFKHLFGGGGGGTGIAGFALSLIFIVVGLIEVVSILFRPVSLSFRLYGNIFAGENILEAMMALVPWLGWIIPLPFYFLELLVGLVQALVFMLLTAVFTALMCAHPEGEHGHGPGEAKGGSALPAGH